MSILRSSISPPLSFRDHSVNAVLWQVHRAGVLSRSELARVVGLNRSSIARVLGELTERGLVEAAGAHRPGTRGRPSLLVQGSPRGPVSLTVRVTQGGIVVAAGALGGHVVHREELRLSTHPVDPITTLERVGELLAGVARRLGRQGVVGAVVVLPGRVVGGAVTSRVLGWESVDVVARLTPHVGALPVDVATAADAAALGEHARGAGAGLSTVIHVGREPEFMAGMVLDGQLFRGASGGAGQIAHLCVNVGGTRCVCGRRGCLEAEIVDSAVLALHSGAEAGDRRSVRGLNAVGRRLGAALQQVTSIINPDALILGGSLGNALPYLGAGITDGYAEDAVAMPRILPAALGPDSALIGGLELGLQRLFAPVELITEAGAPGWAALERRAV